MTPAWNRRDFLLSWLGLPVGFFVTSCRRQPDGDPALFVADLVRRRLSHLVIEPGDLVRFASDHIDHSEPEHVAEIRRRAEESTVEESGAPIDYARRGFEREIVGRFLLSTDFFQHREPSSVRYVAYADPYALGCANPLARRGPETAG